MAQAKYEVYGDKEYPLQTALKLVSDLRKSGRFERVTVRRSGMGMIGGSLTPYAQVLVKRHCPRARTGKKAHRRK